eukprot:jgi/Psemu1/58052/gm1.58052_g
MRVRDNQVLDIAAHRAQRGHPIINLVLHTMDWKFHKDGYPYEFHKVYTTTTGIPSDETGLSVKPPSRSRLVNKSKCEQILLTHYLQAVFGKNKTTDTLPLKRKYHTKPTAPVVSETLPVSNPIKTTSDLLPVQATDSILDTPAPSSNLINPSLNPAKPAKPNSDTAVKICLPYMTRSFDDTNLNNSNSADQPVHCQVADTPTANAPMPNQAPHYAWTWMYSPQSESVSFRRVRSGSIFFKRATSSSPPLQRQDKLSTVIAPSVSPPALIKFGHHSVLPSVPTNFGWTFNSQNKIATFRRLSKSALSPQPPMCNRLQPSAAIAEGTDLPNAAPAYNRSLQSPCCNQIGSTPQPVLRLSKRHRDALKIKMYHLYANILSMNWFYDTVD